ncbi:MAG TPA: metallophosphoesterase family protein [Terriglobales bacterium]|nr:metallophosphoesterase family protein [Terriglobales bacterium]
MRSTTWINFRGILLVSALTCFTAGCCHYPKGRVSKPVGLAAQVPSLTVVAYGDTRTGPLGLGDNIKQAIHGKVVDDIFAQNAKIDAVIFTGDAVMSNFFLWKKDYWRCFLTQTHRFRTHGIPFYPTLGNHEVLPPIVPLLKTTNPEATGFTAVRAQSGAELQSQVVQAYEAGEEPKRTVRELETAPPAEQVDPTTKRGQKLLKQWEKQIAEKNLASTNKFGQFERHLQTSFYTAAVDRRCDGDAATFADDYLKERDYKYLEPLLRGRSYYSQVLQNGGIRLKLIGLDTNCLDSRQQQTFFVDGVTTFNGPIVVFGHHPPVDYIHNPSPWPWDMVPGWDFYKPYFSSPEGKKIVLWIFGHVHDYQRRESTGGNQQPTPPVLLIAGGGGASLDAGAAAFQWQPDAWPPPVVKSDYSQLKLSVTTDNIVVEVRGTSSDTADFQRIDSFSIPIGDASSH